MHKVNIIWDVKNVPFGGGNQFLKRLKDQFVLMGVYSNPSEADVFLFNSHHEIENVRKLKHMYPNKKFVHRIDGPMRLYNNIDDERDDIVIDINKISDGIVFQSWWSKGENLRMYPSLYCKPKTVIHNACDLKRREKRVEGKIKIIAVSMSNNINKGYDIYTYLDDNLDFNYYDFTFVGRSPFKWKNIVDLGVKNSEEVAEILDKHDIFLTASKCDPCSNSLIEALTIGLPALALNGGGHPELVLYGGLLFNDKHDILERLSILASAIDTYSKHITVYSMEETALKYYNFLKSFL